MINQVTLPSNLTALASPIPISLLENDLNYLATALQSTSTQEVHANVTTTQTLTLPANSVISKVVVRNTGVAVNDFRIGTTAGGNDVLPATSITAAPYGSSAITTIHGSSLSLEAFVNQTTLNLTWTAAVSLNVTVIYDTVL